MDANQPIFYPVKENGGERWWRKGHPRHYSEHSRRRFGIGDGKRRPEVMSSRGRSLALDDRLAINLATTKCLPSVKDPFLSPTQQEDARTSKSSA
ncbi:unnamed protein product [Trifolium pratense]|uniref:Uncharacterized protein n=1 Tax=Trifolium pratense TaxID=57577 RepID=A0ACB0KWZ1_TRIPR|nr:unnamed protein product [Trifolium pratense]